MRWAIADSLGFIPEDDPKTCNHNFDPPWRGWLSRFGTPRDIIWMGTCRILHPRRILPAPRLVLVDSSEDSVPVRSSYVKRY